MFYKDIQEFAWEDPEDPDKVKVITEQFQVSLIQCNLFTIHLYNMDPVMLLLTIFFAIEFYKEIIDIPLLNCPFFKRFTCNTVHFSVDLKHRVIWGLNCCFIKIYRILYNRSRNSMSIGFLFILSHFQN